MATKREFSEWLGRLVKPEFLTERFIAAAWQEALGASANGTSFELEGRYTLLGRPYLFCVGV
jgi:hypothetical protein